MRSKIGAVVLAALMVAGAAVPALGHPHDPVPNPHVDDHSGHVGECYERAADSDPTNAIDHWMVVGAWTECHADATIRIPYGPSYDGLSDKEARQAGWNREAGLLGGYTPDDLVSGYTPSNPRAAIVWFVCWTDSYAKYDGATRVC